MVTLGVTEQDNKAIIPLSPVPPTSSTGMWELTGTLPNYLSHYQIEAVEKRCQKNSCLRDATVSNQTRRPMA